MCLQVKVGTGRGGKSQRVEGVYIEEASSSQQIGLATMLIEELQLSPEQLAQIPFLGFVNYPTSKTPLFAVGATLHSISVCSLFS